jgi:formylglycine-generating enzyme required for sulfatase activity
MRFQLGIIGALTALFVTSNSFADTFGTGGNQFTIDFQTIGNPGNAGSPVSEPASLGSVNYEYRIGTYEINEAILVAANAEGNLGISFSSRGDELPVTNITWNAAARFVNWLNVSSGYAPAYYFPYQPGEEHYSPDGPAFLWSPSDEGYDASNPIRNANAHYFLPTTDEWHKAAYYDPSSGTYFTYATGSNVAPTPVAGGTAPGTAVYLQPDDAGPAEVTSAGGLSAYGTMGQGGNVFEFTETTTSQTTIWGDYPKDARGGNWFNDASFLAATGPQFQANPQLPFENYGFRVASIPEPSIAALALSAVVFAIARRSHYSAARRQS